MVRCIVAMVCSSAFVVRGARSLSAVSSARPAILSKLQDPSLLSGRISSTETPHSFAVSNPANQDTLGFVPVQDEQDTVTAIKRSHEVLCSQWRDKTTRSQRAAFLGKWSQLIQDNRQDIATIATLESGKPLKESLGEVTYAASFLDYYAGEAIRPDGWTIPTPFSHSDGSPRGQVMTQSRPVGVCAFITPWNFPLAMITRKIAPALAAGCCAVTKPSELTPLSAIALQELADRAGIPEGVLQTITTNTDTTSAVGKVMCTDPLVSKVSFTGSTNVGKQLYQWSSSTVKRLSLELGGNAPFVVFDDADMDVAVQAAMASKLRNAGQTCVSADRFLVHSSVYERFCERFANAMEGVKIGDGMDDTVSMGPLISAQACDKVHIKVVESKGHVVTGGSKLEDLGPNFYSPTLLKDVPIDSEIWTTETFGPVAAVSSFDTEEEALEICNDSRVGLASYFVTKDVSRCMRFGAALETGLVGINEGVISTCAAPFGGCKESGLGREGSPMGIQEYLDTKYVFINT